MTAELLIKFEDVRGLMGSPLLDKMDEIASQIARQLSEQFYRTMDAVTEESGNRVDAGGQPLDKEVMLEMFNKVEWSPKSVFLAHPDMAKVMGEAWQNWQKDKEYMDRFRSVEVRKREEWRARESRRKLVD